MGSVDQLQKKYPSIPRELIIKFETLRLGIRDSDVLAKEGVWRRTAGGFLTVDRHVTIEEMAKKRPETVKPGYQQLAGEMFMRNGLGSMIQRTASSPYQIREEGPKKYALYEGEDRVDDVWLHPANHWIDEPDKEPRTSKGTPITSLVTRYRRCFIIAPMRYCEFFSTGDECKYCNYNSTHTQATAVGNKHAVTINLDETLEAFRILASEVPLVEGRFQSGAISNIEKEANQQFRFLEGIANAASYKPHLGLSVPPMPKKDLQRLKDAGLDCINMNLEVWDREIFAEVCPGKNKSRGYDTYLQSYIDAVDVFGAGRVGCAFVGGVTMLAKNGHSTWQEARDSLIEGNTWMIKHGVLPIFFSVWLGAGSRYGDDPTSESKLPPTDYFLDAAFAHHKDCLETGMYDNLAKLMFCPLDCAAHFYCGDLQMVDKGGDLGSWIADTVPADANWMSRFISSVKAGRM